MNDRPAPRHIHIVEPGPLGHGPMWLDYLLDALMPCDERITVTHPDKNPYLPLQQRAASSNGRLTTRPIPWRTDKQSWPDTLKGAKTLGSDLALLTFIDVIIKKHRGDLSQQLGAPVWGLWFLPGQRRSIPRLDPRRIWSGRARGIHQDQRVLRRVPQWLSGILLLDELLTERITPRPGLSIEVLPDPWPTKPTISQREARERLQLPLDAKLFLHFGVANTRKGLQDAAAAWQRLRDVPSAVLVRAGMTLDAEATVLAPLVNEGRAVLRDQRIPDEDVDLYFRAADWILVPYRRHEGSSGLLSAAAASHRPLIAADYAVIGQRVRQQQLGLLFEHESVDGLLAAVREALHIPIERYRNALSAYADSHDLQHFYAALRTALGLRVVAPDG